MREWCRSSVLVPVAVVLVATCSCGSSAGDILVQAQKVMSRTRSVHLTSVSYDAGTPTMTEDVVLGEDGVCSGAVTIGDAHVRVRATSIDDRWIQADRAWFVLELGAGAGPAMADLVGDRWVADPRSHAFYSCDLDSIVVPLVDDETRSAETRVDPDATSVTVTRTQPDTTLDLDPGTVEYEVDTVVVSLTAPHRVLSQHILLDGRPHLDATYSAYDEPVSVSPPPAARIVTPTPQ